MAAILGRLSSCTGASSHSAWKGYSFPVEVQRHASADDLAESAARLVFDDCRATLEKRPGSYVLGLSGGRTPVRMFRFLAQLSLPWRHVHVFQVDERVAPHRSEDRNFTQLTDQLLQRVDIPCENIHSMPVESSDLAAACRCYEGELVHITGGAPIDFIQLGLGDDGHTASLAPGDPILGMTDRDIWHVERFNGLPRMSMTYRAINRSNRIMWLAAGHAKAEMCRRLLAGDQTIPAGRVTPDRAVLLLDEAAAVGL
jgi:6-phosphogluconolactonase